MVQIGALVLALLPCGVSGQEKTNVIGPGHSDVQGGRIQAGSWRVRTIVEAQGRAQEQSVSTWKVVRFVYQGIPALASIRASAQGGTDTLIVAERDLRPLALRVNNARQTISVEYTGVLVRGEIRSEQGATTFADTLDTAPFDESNVDMLIGALPLAIGYKARIPLFYPYRAGLRTVSWEEFEVTGEETKDGKTYLRGELRTSGVTRTVMIDAASHVVTDSRIPRRDGSVIRITRSRVTD